MAIPKQIDPRSLADYLAVMSRAIFQAGMSWALIENKWPAYERLFEGFDPAKIALFDDFDIDRRLLRPLLSDRWGYGRWQVSHIYPHYSHDRVLPGLCLVDGRNQPRDQCPLQRR